MSHLSCMNRADSIATAASPQQHAVCPVITRGVEVEAIGAPTSTLLLDENCLAPGDPCSLSPSVLSSLASSLGTKHTATAAPDATGSSHYSGSSLTVGSEIGIAVGAVCGVLLVGLLLVFLAARVSMSLRSTSVIHHPQLWRKRRSSILHDSRGRVPHHQCRIQRQQVAG